MGNLAIENTGPIPLRAGENLGAFRRVKLDGSGDLVYADAGEESIGATCDEYDDGELGSVKPFGTPGVWMMTASAAVTALAAVYGSADGKVSSTAVGPKIGYALQAASGDNSVVPVLVVNEAGVGLGSPLRVSVKTAAYNVEAADCGTIFSSKGAAGEITGTLPVATVGLFYGFYVGAAQEHRVDPDGAEQICLPSTGVPSAAGAYLTANAIGETLWIVCTEAGVWAVFGFTGTWTAV